jgi:hypothetical protein
VIEVRIKENSWLAKMAAKRLGFTHVAMVIGRTIYLHNIPSSHFASSKRWLIHELKHVDQFRQHGFIGFLWNYLVEYTKNGYYNNKYEVEAREEELNESLLKKYKIILPVPK